MLGDRQRLNRLEGDVGGEEEELATMPAVIATAPSIVTQPSESQESNRTRPANCS